MRIKDAQQILDDYEVCRLNFDKLDYTDYDAVRAFFMPDGVFGNNGYSTYDIKLANNVGQKCLNKLTEYIFGFVFDSPGKWINFVPKDDKPDALILAEQLNNDLNKRLLETNFYQEGPKLVRDGLAWNQGLMDTKYSNGVYYRTVDPSNLIVSNTSSGNNRRAYSVDEIPLVDLAAEYKLPEHLQQRMDQKQDTNDMFPVLTAIIPNTDMWLAEKQKTDNKFVTVYLLLESDPQQLIELKENKNIGYRGFPVQCFRPHTSSSLCREALSDSAFGDYYTVSSRDKAEYSTWPSMVTDEENWRNNTFNFRSGAVNPARQGGILPQPIKTVEGGDPFNFQMIQKLEFDVNKSFKIDKIERMEQVSVQGPMYFSLKAKILRELYPMLGPLSTGVASDLLNRTHNLLLSTDKEYAGKYKALDGQFLLAGIDAEIEKAETLVAVNQLAQITGGISQVLPQFIQRIDPDKLALTTLYSLNLLPVAKSTEQVAEEMKAQADQVRRQQQMGEAQQAAGIQETQAKAEALKQPK